MARLRPARLAAAAAMVVVATAPIGDGTAVAAPPEPTEQRTHCATAAPLSVDRTAAPAGHTQLDIADAWRFSRGAGVTVAVIDTGVTPHARLPSLTGGGDYVSTGDGLADCDLHGTVVAGIIAARPSPSDGFAGVAPEASVISIRQSSGAYDRTLRQVQGTGGNQGTDGTQGTGGAVAVGAGYGPISTLAAAIVRSAESGAKVINISEVACAPVDEPFDDGVVARALEVARARDAVVVAAAGNLSAAGGCRDQNPVAAPSGPAAWQQVRSVPSPARFGRQILTVAAVDSTTAAPAEFSLRGPWVTVAAPGTEIVSLVGGRLIDALSGDTGPRPIAGTSYATAYVSGVVALVRARYPELNATQVTERIIATARGGPQPDASVGYGIVDPVAALTADLTEVEPLPDPHTTRPLATPRTRDADRRPLLAVATVAALAAIIVAATFAGTMKR